MLFFCDFIFAFKTKNDAMKVLPFWTISDKVVRTRLLYKEQQLKKQAIQNWNSNFPGSGAMRKFSRFLTAKSSKKTFLVVNNKNNATD